MSSPGLAALPGLHTRGTASGLLSGHTTYLHWGVIQISLTNFVIIVVMVVLFALALVLPFPGAHADPADDAHPAAPIDTEESADADR